LFVGIPLHMSTNFQTFLSRYGILIVVLVIFLSAWLLTKRNTRVGFSLTGLFLLLLSLYTRRYSDWHLPAPASSIVGVMAIRVVALGLLFLFFLNDDDG
jgi:hypothetical protein